MNSPNLPFDGVSFAKHLPQEPGVYKMYHHNKLLYVGKAKDLSKRVLSYFTQELNARHRRMISQITHIDTVVVPTEMDALVLESRLIKQENPKYNIMLKDDRGYPYIHVSTHKPAPQIMVHYGDQIKEGRLFGPFPSRHAVYEAIDTLRKHFQVRSCTDLFFSTRSRPCLEYQIKRCSAPCVQKISLEEYRQSIQDMCDVLDGKSASIIANLSASMQSASDQMDFEKAMLLRDKIVAIRHVQSKVVVEAGEGDYDVLSLAFDLERVVGVLLFVRKGKISATKTVRVDRGLEMSEDELMQHLVMRLATEKHPHSPCLVLASSATSVDVVNKALAQMSSAWKVKRASSQEEQDHFSIAHESAQSSLQSWQSSAQVRHAQLLDLKEWLGLEHMPERVECFDISHTQGQDTVASKVVFGVTGPLKSLYRRYNIDQSGGDDLKAMREALHRRFSKQDHLPDVLLIDGGHLQVQQALDVLDQLGLDLPCVGVSKGPDRIEGDEVLIVGRTGEEVAPGSRSKALQFIQQVRNEAHRFAVEGHRKKRDKRMVRSVLEQVEGLGPSKRQALLHHFGGLDGVRNATLEQLLQTPGLGPKMAQRVYDILHKTQ